MMILYLLSEFILCSCVFSVSGCVANSDYSAVPAAVTSTTATPVDCNLRSAFWPFSDGSDSGWTRRGGHHHHHLYAASAAPTQWKRDSSEVLGSAMMAATVRKQRQLERLHFCSFLSDNAAAGRWESKSSSANQQRQPAPKCAPPEEVISDRDSDRPAQATSATTAQPFHRHRRR